MTSAEVSFTEIAGIRTAELILSSDVGGRGLARQTPTNSAILMLHGWGASLKLMKPLADRMAALGYTVYSFDFPGFGASDPPPTAWSCY